MDSFLIPALTTLGYSFPELLLQLALGLYQAWMIQAANAGAATEISAIFARLGIARMLINCVSLTGLVMIVWGLCKATRPEKSAVSRSPPELVL